MSVRLILPSATGQIQPSILNRLVEDITIIDLTDRPNDSITNTNQVAVPFDGVNDRFLLDNADVGILVMDMASPMKGPDTGNQSNRIAFEGWFKDTNTGLSRSTIFDFNVMRQKSGTITGFDGFYQLFVTKDESNLPKLEFRVVQELAYSVTGTTSVSAGSIADNTPFYHYYVAYSQATSTMQMYLGTNKEAEVSFSAFLGNSNSAVTSEATGLIDTDSFQGIMDEIRIWSQTASVSSIGILSSVTAIGKDPNKLSSSGEMGHDNLVLWWRLETTEAGELFNGTPSSIQDFAFTDSGNLTALTASNSSLSAHFGTPSGFSGADLPINEYTIISGLSATGNLIAAQGQGDVLFGGGGTLDHGGLLVVDTRNQKVLIESPVEPVNTLKYLIWSTSGNTTTAVEENQLFAGVSAIRVTVNDGGTSAGVFTSLSTSAMIYENHPYATSFRIRAVPRVDASVSHTVLAEFEVGGQTTTSTIDYITNVWTPVLMSVTSGINNNTSQLRIYNNSGVATDFYIDGLNIFLADYPGFFTPPDTLRKGGQLVYHITEVV